MLQILYIHSWEFNLSTLAPPQSRKGIIPSCLPESVEKFYHKSSYFTYKMETGFGKGKDFTMNHFAYEF
jgi:hypothetical protein